MARNPPLSGTRGVCAVGMIVARKRGIAAGFSRFGGAQLFYSPRNRGNMDRFYRFRSSSISAAQAPSSPWQKSSRHSTVPASRRTALLSAHILPVCSLIAPCPAGAGTVSVLAGLSPRTASNGRSGRDSGDGCRAEFRSGDEGRWCGPWNRRIRRCLHVGPSAPP